MLEVPGCGSLKNIMDMSGLVKCVGMVGNELLQTQCPCPLAEQAQQEVQAQVKGSDQIPPAT